MGPSLRRCAASTNFLWKEPDFVPWSLPLDSVPLLFLLPPFLSFPSLLYFPCSAANIACGFLMSVGMHEVREPPRSSRPPRPCLSDDVDCAELCTWGGWFGGGGRRPLAMVLLDLMIVG